METLDFLRWLMPLFPMTLGFADDDGGDDDKGNDEGKVSREDYDKVMQEKDDLSKQVEDVRGEVFTPEYLDFLDRKEKGGYDDPKLPKEPEIPDDKLEKLSKREILELAEKNVMSKVDQKLSRAEKTFKNKEDDRTKKEVTRFAKTHEDYEKFRPVMYGLSLDPKHKDLGLQELYDKAKDHIKTLYDGPTKEDIKKAKAMSGMKPGSSSGSYKSDEKMDADKASKEALEEIEEKLGPIPSE